jgi:hypothetical protein
VFERELPEDEVTSRGVVEVGAAVRIGVLALDLTR